MSKKVLLIAGVVLAAGSVAAISSPYFRDGQLRLGQRLNEFGSSDAEDGARRSGRRDWEMGAERRGRGGRRFDGRDKAAGDDSEGLTSVRHGRSGKRENDDDAYGQELSERLWRWFGGRSHERGGAEEAELGLGHSRRHADEARRPSSRQQADRSDRRFSRLDRNGDGVIDARDFDARAAEIAAAAARRFLERYDANGDGKVSRDEFERVAKDKSQSRVADLELDGEDIVTEADQPIRQPRRGILE